MSVKFYNWGTLSGGSGSGGGGTVPAGSDFGDPDPFEGTIGVAATTVTFTRDTKNVKVINTSATNMEISFDNGTTWLTITQFGSDSYPISVASMLLRGNTATYEVIATLQGS